MATYEKRIALNGKKRIRAVIRIAGFPPERATFDTMEKARTWAKKKEADMLDNRYGLAVVGDQHTVAEMIKRYQKKILPFKSKKIRYLLQQNHQLEWWKQEIGDYTLTNVTKSLLADCLEKLAAQVGPATVNRYLAALNAVFRKAVKEWEWLKTSPLSLIGKMKEGKGRDRYLREYERPSLMNACKMEKKKPLWLICMLAICCGARKEEILGLKIENINLERGAATTEETKNNESKTFFITGYALEQLRAYLAEKVYNRRVYVFPNRFGNKPMTIDREWCRARDRAGLINFHFHDLRHTFASYLAMEGATPRDVAEALNQKTLKMAMRYSHLSKTHVASKIQAMTDRIFNQGENINGN